MVNKKRTSNKTKFTKKKQSVKHVYKSSDVYKTNVKSSDVFTIEQPNQCKLKFNIPLSMVNNINTLLQNGHETSGVIKCDNNNNVVGMKTEKGSADSVHTSNNVINFHTHPISAYNQGDTVWGWPSGEDIRETIKFSLAGNKAHLVFSVEGLYTIQVSPCKIRKMKELLDDQERGILIFIIEEFFKTTHNFRGVQEVNELAKKNIFINPYSYVDFVNTFDLVNLLNAKKIIHTNPKNEHIKNIGHTGIHGDENINKYGEGDSIFTRIPNVGFPDITNGKIINQSIKEYIDRGDLKELRKIDTKGEEDDLKIKNIDILIEKLKDILKKFDSKECNITWNHTNNAWFFVNFFPSNNYREKSYFKTKFVTPSKVPVTTDVEPFIRVFSDKKEGCTVNEIAHNNKFKFGKMTSIGTCKNCGFGKLIKNKNKRYYIPTLKSTAVRCFTTLKTLYSDLKKVTGKRTALPHVYRNKFGSDQPKKSRSWRKKLGLGLLGLGAIAATAGVVSNSPRGRHWNDKLLNYGIDMPGIPGVTRNTKLKIDLNPFM
jgi:hypothetical protein